MAKLTKPQHEALRVLAVNSPRSAYPHLKINTLWALQSQGLVDAAFGPGSMAFPNTSIKWSITDAGRAALAAREGK